MSAGSDFLQGRFLIHIFGRPRLLICVVVGVVAFVLTPSAWHTPSRVLVAWNLATWLYIGLATWLMWRSSESSIRRHAVQTDESRFVVLVLAIGAALASLAAIVAELSTVKDAPDYLKTLHLCLAAATIISAWTFIQLIFAQHYAHEFFVERASEKSLPPDARGGLRFPATQRPAFVDFLYYSFVIGCACQTADVETTTGPMRLLTLIHGVISFFFNTTILALTINIASGLV